MKCASHSHSSVLPQESQRHREHAFRLNWKLKLFFLPRIGLPTSEILPCRHEPIQQHTAWLPPSLKSTAALSSSHSSSAHRKVQCISLDTFPQNSIKVYVLRKATCVFSDLRTESKVACKEELTGWKPSRNLHVSLFHCNSLLNFMETDKINIPSAQTIQTS